jgi:ElaA protein
MSKLEWEVKVFQKLSVDQLFEILQLRVDVFVVEQQCAYPELDDYDRHEETRHVFAHDEGSRLIAYVRILPPGLRHPEVCIGRFVVRLEARGKGIGHQLLRNALDVIHECWSGCAIRISAQEYLQGFYVQYRFTRVSDVYLEDGIPHVEMVRKPS